LPEILSVLVFLAGVFCTNFIAITTFKNPRIGGVNSTKMTLGDRIQLLRKEKGLTQSALANTVYQLRN
jgi:hypothetical protein